MLKKPLHADFALYNDMGHMWAPKLAGCADGEIVRRKIFIQPSLSEVVHTCLQVLIPESQWAMASNS